jgi:5-methylcytosine-specific restriction enzyme subunit McrC
MARKPKASNSPAVDIEATDLSEIRTLGNDDEQWLRRVAHYANTGELTISLSGQKGTESEPLLRFDTTSNSWWTGRYIGEVQLEGRTLRIAPRFGDVQLSRWLSRIWGVQLTPIQGQYSRSKLWIWHLIARLWESQLVSAAKHGLPTRRKDEVHIGRSVRGRLDVLESVKQFIAGKQCLISRSREKCVDQAIACVLTNAWMHLHKEVAKGFNQMRWLSPNADDLVSRLRACSEARGRNSDTNGRVKIRYTPITESYRPVVELSLSILANRGVASSASGKSNVLGTLIDMAEVWELYLFHLLRSALPEVAIRHTGRGQGTAKYLFHSFRDSDSLGGLRPDILVYESSGKRLIGVLDAKYKVTKPSPDRPRGILREDLYQLNAYMSAFGIQSNPIVSALVYPSYSADLQQLSERSPYRTAANTADAHFLCVPSDEPTLPPSAYSPQEQQFIERVRELFRVAI